MWSYTKQKRLMTMAADPKPEIRATAAAHPRLPEEVLLILIRDMDIRVRRAAVKNPSITRLMLDVVEKEDTDQGMQAYARSVLGELDA